jgi:hypothetical protein
LRYQLLPRGLIPPPATGRATADLRRTVVAVGLAVAIPGLGALRRPLSGRAVHAMILAFFVAPFNRAVWPDGHGGSGIAGAFHREIISWMVGDRSMAGANPRGGADRALLAGAPRASRF